MKELSFGEKIAIAAALAAAGALFYLFWPQSAEPVVDMSTSPQSATATDTFSDIFSGR